MASKSKADIRRGVHSRIRKKVRGTSERPRLAVFRSVSHIYAQVIDDDNGKTLAAASTTEKDLGVKSGGNIEAAETVGKAVAKRALAAGVSQVVFDRGGYVYHGRVKALIDATRVGLDKNQDDASDEDSADKGTLETVATTVGNIFGAVTGAISNFVEDITETPAKKSGGKDTQKTVDEPQAQTDEVKEENNENE
ncbi:MAG TPA: 50S ribosomal protein L18 [Pyrinomonadaceae bacterium]|nr:50S ribosomal protein L18 [Pyrinomonadaceae bacterium]